MSIPQHLVKTDAPTGTHVLPFTVEPIEDQYLLVNEVGQFVLLAPEQLTDFINNNINPKDELYQKLVDLNFINTKESYERMIKLYAQAYSFTKQSTSLFIIIPTLRCDHHCTYCHASHQKIDAQGYDMTPEMASHVAQFVTNSPNKYITVEFQGGECLLNFPIVKQLFEEITANKGNKEVTFSVVTNLNNASDEIIDFLVDNDIQVCSSLDGPEALHNKNRVLAKQNSFQITVDRFKEINKRQKKLEESGQRFSRPNLLLTISRESLQYAKEIVDTYRDLGQELIAIRALNPFGLATKHIKTIGYSADEFLNFYRQVMDYILEINLQGQIFIEQITAIYLSKILKQKATNYMDIRSPCGAAIGQVAIDYNGKIYTCDEGRMMAQMGDDTFLVGQVPETSFAEMVNHPATQACCVASCLESNPGCEHCVYKPYCGVCPVYNYAQHGNIFGIMPINERCKIQKGILDYIFGKIKSGGDEINEVFNSWVTHRDFSNYYLG